MPTPAGSLGAGIGRLRVAVGGEDPTRVIDAVQAYDLESEEWTAAAPADGRRATAPPWAAIGSSLYALDGAIAPTHAESTRVGRVARLRARLAPQLGAVVELADDDRAGRRGVQAELAEHALVEVLADDLDPRAGG